MLGMLSMLWTATGLNKLWPYMVVAGIVCAVVVAAYLQGRQSGQASAKSKQLTDSLNQLSKEAKDRAVIQSMRSSAAREQLRKRWSSQ